MEFTTLLVTVEFIYYEIKADTDKTGTAILYVITITPFSYVLF